MTILSPYIPNDEEQHNLDLWVKSEAHRFYVQTRRENCSFLELMDLWLQTPVCVQCGSSDPSLSGRAPDVGGIGWREALEWQIGVDAVKRIETLISADHGFNILCFSCQQALAPWKGDELYVDTIHLEEYFSIPVETPGKRSPEKKLRHTILELYDRVCFGCNRSDLALHMDHIRPQSKGGDAAFRNLQPLCQECGEIKGDRDPNEVGVYSDTSFGPYPSDGQAVLLPEG